MTTSKTLQKGNIIERMLGAIDRLQQRHRALSFPYAVVKKYGDDEAGYLGALITYYGFLSLFPLLIVATSIVDIISHGRPQIQEKLISTINDYFPALGNDLASSVHGSTKTGLALVVGLLITFYGAKGVADAVQHALNHVWEVPKQQRAGFPKGILKSFVLIIGAGLGFMSAAVLSGYATAAFSDSLYLRLIPIVASFLMLLAVFTFVFRAASSAKHAWRELLPGAALAAVGLQILQTIGGYLITHQLHDSSGAYGRFGLVLAILFWIYLQAQVFLYAAELNSVITFKLYPRSLTQKPLTEADKHAYELYAKRETYQHPPETVIVEFNEKT